MDELFKILAATLTGVSVERFQADAKREYAHGPAQGLPDTRVGTFTQALHN